MKVDTKSKSGWKRLPVQCQDCSFWDLREGKCVKGVEPKQDELCLLRSGGFNHEKRI